MVGANVGISVLCGAPHKADEQTSATGTLTGRARPEWDSQFGRFKEVAFVDPLHDARSTISIISIALEGTRRGDEIRLLTKTLSYFTPRRKLYPL